MNAGTDLPQHTSRRERRAADRRRAAGPRRRPARADRGSPPIVRLTAIAGAAAVMLIASVVLLQGGGPATTEAAGLTAPRDMTPASQAEGRALGRSNAPVTLDVWSDYQCPACGQYARAVEPMLVREFVVPGVLRIVHHDAAFQGQRGGGSYDESVEAGAGARCAANQDRFWPLHDWLFANQSGENEGAFAANRLRALAGSAGVDVEAWDACMATGSEQAAVRAETQQGAAAGVAATPTMTINGETIVGLRSATDLGTMIQAAATAGGS